jgi:hypothetical protein
MRSKPDQRGQEHRSAPLPRRRETDQQRSVEQLPGPSDLHRSLRQLEKLARHAWLRSDFLTDLRGAQAVDAKLVTTSQRSTVLHQLVREIRANRTTLRNLRHECFSGVGYGLYPEPEQRQLSNVLAQVFDRLEDVATSVERLAKQSGRRATGQVTSFTPCVAACARELVARVESAYRSRGRGDARSMAMRYVDLLCQLANLTPASSSRAGADRLRKRLDREKLRSKTDAWPDASVSSFDSASFQAILLRLVDSHARWAPHRNR